MVKPTEPLSDNPGVRAQQRILCALMELDDEAGAWAALQLSISHLLEATKSSPAKARDMLDTMCDEIMQNMPQGGYR